MNDTIEWDPSTKRFEEQEEAMLGPDGRLKEKVLRSWTDRTIAAICAMVDGNAQPDHELGAALQSTVQV